MPRSLVLGNGEILLGLDHVGQVRDFYFPYVGLENHTSDCVHKIGVWVDGAFSWISDRGWSVSVDYANETLVSNIKARNGSLGIELLFIDTVYNEQNIFLRKVSIKNLVPREREIRIFFNQQFQISGVSHGNTAYFDPDLGGIVHYRGRRTFLVSGKNGENTFQDYGVGLFNIEGKEGTWKDAEDGVLSKNPIEHGSVDSTISFIAKIAGDKETTIYYWIIAGETLYEVKGMNKYILLKTPEHLIETTTNYWHAWVNKLELDFASLDGRLVKLFKRSLLIMRTHVDNRGAIIASGDSDILQYGRDTYSYMWPRDGAISAMALDRAGYFEATKHFFDFAREVLSDEGFVHHKYQADKSLGSSWHSWVHNGRRQLAIQEDETALLLVALGNHYRIHKDLEFIEEIYNPFIKKIADFLYFYRDEKTGLPHGSYDLWEEKFGTSTFTASAVYGALSAASHFSEILGKHDEAEKYREAALGVQRGIGTILYNKEVGYFYKLVDFRFKEPVFDAKLDVSSFYGPFRFGVFPPDDARLIASFETLQRGPCCVLREGSIGGIIRYEGDMYMSKHRNVSGNPWFITTLWMYQYEIARVSSIKELDLIGEKLLWVSDRAQTSGILSEQVDPFSGEQISVAPLTWSHAEYIMTILDLLEKRASLRQ